MPLLYNPTSIQAASLLQRRPASKAQETQMLSQALMDAKEKDPLYKAALDRKAYQPVPRAGAIGEIAKHLAQWEGEQDIKALDQQYQDKQARQNEMYSQILSGGEGGQSVMDNLPPQQREIISRVLQSGDSDLIQAVVGQVVQQSFEPGMKTKVEYIDGPDGKYAVDPAKPDAPPRKVLDAKPSKPQDVQEYEYAKAQFEEANPGQRFMPFTDFDTSRRKAGASNTSVTNMMPGPKKADEAFASGPYVDWLSGGYANVQKNIQSLDEAIGQLSAAEPGDLSGPGVGLIPDAAKPFVAPQSLDVQQRVEQVVQGGMREVLGGQYTQNEADAYIKRMYNPSLSEAANVKRLQAFRNQLMRGAQAKQASSMYFQKNGTLEGYQGQMPSWDDFYSAIGEKRESGGETTFTKTATNPQTGEKMGFDGTKWVKIK